MKLEEYIKVVYMNAEETLDKGKDGINPLPLLNETYNIVLNASDEVYDRMKNIREEVLNWGEDEEYKKYKLMLQYLVRRQVMIEEPIYGKYRRIVAGAIPELYVQLPLSIAKKVQYAGIDLYEINKLKKLFVKFNEFFMLL